MHTFAKKPKGIQENTSAKPPKPSRAFLGQSRDVRSLLYLQRTIGNQAMQRSQQAEPEDLEASSASKMSSRLAFDFSRIQVHDASSRRQVQFELKVSEPGDQYEQEADRVADQVMRTQYAPGGGRASAPDISRLPMISPAMQPQTENEVEEEMLQAKSADRSGAPRSANADTLVGRAQQGSGQPLPDTVRARMEPAFGADFSAVRLYAGSDAAVAARAVQARAFTTGNNIVFGAGEKQLDTTAGQRLLAHELTHVVQQQSGRSQHVHRQALSTEPTRDEEDTFEPTGRSTHEWRTALINARNDMVGHMMDAKQEFFQRHTEALTQFERTMDFASEKSAAGLILSAQLNQLLGQLPAPMSTIVTQVTIVADAFQQASASAGAVNLDTWIEQKRNGLQAMREATIDPGSWSEITDINTRIESLVTDSSTDVERERQQWELSMLNSSFGVTPTAQEIEFALYDEWCYKKGAYFVFNTYQTDRHYPGSQEIGRTDQSHAAFGGEQRWARNVPSQILDRLHRLGLRPERTLTLPREIWAHDRISERRGGLNARYSAGDVSRYMPYHGERAENWTGPERFRE